MPDLRDRLRDAVPAEASFTTAEVNRRADGAVRRRRSIGVAAIVILVAVAAGVWQLAGDDDSRVLLESPVDTASGEGPPAALDVFDLPPLSAEERAAVRFGDQLPPGTRVAREVDGLRFLVAPSPTGGFCLAVDRGEESVVLQSPRCDAPPVQSGVFYGAEGWLAWLVPDGYDRAALPDGRTADVVNNVVVFPATTTEPEPERVTFSGPAGELVVRDGEPPFPELTPAFPDGLTADAPAPDQGMRRAVGSWFASTVNWLYQPDLSGVGVAIDDEDGHVWIAPRDGGDGVCLLDVPADGSVGQVACGPEELSTRWPFLVSVRTTDGGWAALVAEGWDVLELPDGTVIPVDHHVIWLDHAGEVPETATLVGDGRQTPVALRAAVESAAPRSRPDPAVTTESGTGQPVTYSVFDRPAAVDDPRLESIRDETAVMFPSQGDPVHTPDLDTARLAHESADLAVFATRPRLGDGICLLTVPAEAGGGCTDPPGSLSDPLPQRGFASSPELGVRMIEPIPDGYDTYVLDDGTEIPIPSNVLVVAGFSPADLSGELRGPAGTARIDFGGDPGLDTPSTEAIEALADVCPADLPHVPTENATTPPAPPTVEVTTPPAGLRVLPPDGTGIAGQYEPSMDWTAFTTHGYPVLLGDGQTLAASDARVVVAPFATPLPGGCATMRLTIDQRDGRVIQLTTPRGPVTAVAIDGSSPMVIWIDPATGTQLQLFADGTADLDLLIEVATETVVTG